jgi:hypothetical protein
MQEARTGQRQYLGWGKQDMNTKSWWEKLFERLGIEMIALQILDICFEKGRNVKTTQDRIQRWVLVSKMLSKFMEAGRPAMWMECPQGSRHESELRCRSGLLTPAAWFSGSSNLATAPAATDQSKPRSFEMWQIVITCLKNYEAIKYENSFIWV